MWTCFADTGRCNPSINIYIYTKIGRSGGQADIVLSSLTYNQGGCATVMGSSLRSDVGQLVLTSPLLSLGGEQKLQVLTRLVLTDQ